MSTCRFCHVQIEHLGGQWASDYEADEYDLYCPNNVIGLHRPFVREDAITALGWIYGELSS